VIDPLTASTFALTSPSPIAVGTIFIAGALTSAGPCIAPRYVALAAIAGGYRHPIVPTLVFVAGLLGAFMALGFGAGLLGAMWSFSPLLYALLAAGLVAGGCITLARAAAQPAGHAECSAACPESRTAAGQRSLGGVFLLGMASTLVVSPCCTPVIASVIGASTAIGKPVFGMILLASFALGHMLPLFFAGSVSSIFALALRWRLPEQAPRIVSGSLMLALGAYYAVLA
jgi:cytochrome c-type biogenesis protein